MINGDLVLREKYPEFDDESRTPNGIDLRLGNVYELDDSEEYYGLKNGKKIIPEHIEVEMEDGGWMLYPNKPYILQVDGQIKISEDSAQMYTSRSTLLRSGSSLLTAIGDSGYNGKLAFLFINFGKRPYFISKNERFAQLVDFEVKDNSLKYDGDYQEE